MAIVILGELIGISSKKFSVTPKGNNNKKRGGDLRLTISHILLFAANIAGIVIASIRVQETGINLYLIPIIWMGVNTFYLLFALLFDFRRSRQYKSFKPNAVKHYGFKSYLGLLKRGS